MRFVIVRDGVVVNAVLGDAPRDETWIASDGAQIGWLYDGDGFAQPADPGPVVPAAVTMRQARLALLGAGLLGSVQTAIDALPSPQKEAAQIEWDYSNELQRDNPFVALLAPALGLTTEQLDALFITAAGL